MLMVKKFGGTSVANKEKIFNVANRCIEDYKKGNKIVLVLSAMGKHTDELVSLANDISEVVPKREMDMLFTVGEQITVSLMAMAFDKLGIPAISLNAFQVRMFTDNNYGDAKITRIETERIEKELSENKIVIVTGFQGIDKDNNYTTLGRGGSDTTAVALASALKADSCEIYTDVDGVYTADPRIVNNAIKLETISYDEMLEFSNLGAGVLHNKSVKIAKENDIKLIVRSSMSREEGTTVANLYTKISNLPKITGVTSNKNTVSIVGKDIDTETKDKVIESLTKNNLKFNNLDQTNMHISINVKNEDINPCIRCIHDLFFKK
ncbi:MAG: aspartate kinase [Clostridia bacterium]|nr:aspartate kinase [Clostridia bacterium]